VTPAAHIGPGSSGVYEAARLRWATERDAQALLRVWQASRRADGSDAEEETIERMGDWLEHGGAVLLEDGNGSVLCAVRWRWRQDGWRVDRIATLEQARGQGFGRWLMTKLEALAIKRNVPTLTLELDQSELLPYYQRLGYGLARRDGSVVTLVKRVGGTWQRQPDRRA